ncbi:MAG TPA: transglycosylase SLT domain-containing protein [Blastocatellia bacterium]|nr:transglycosylase SLT domain-containing protein [Blastocatellia bacterium]
MPSPIGRLLMRTKRRSAVIVLPMLAFVLITPMTVSCQLGAANPDNGIEELRGLVRAASGRPAASELTRIESRYPRTRTAALARFLRGYLDYNSQNYPAAIEALDGRIISSTTSLGDYAFYYRAESAAASEGKSSARRDFETVYARHPESLKVREARLRAAEMAVAVGDPRSAIKDLARMVEANDSDAAYITAQSHEAMGNRDRAVELYRKVYYELAATSASVQAEARLAALNANPKDNPGSFTEERARADALFHASQYAEAAAAYDQLIARFPEADRIDEIHLRRGVSLLNSKQPAQAIAALVRVSDRSPELRAEAMLHQAEALRRANRSAESSLVVDRLLAQYPRTGWGSEALYALAAYLNKQDRTSEAATRYRQLLASFPKSPYAPEASYNLGWLAYKSNSFADAARILEQHLASYRHPDTRFIGEACLWAAKSEERLGHKSRALALYDLVIERYRYGYHGYVAGLRSEALRKGDRSLKPEVAKPGSELESIRANVTYVEPIRETSDGSEVVRIAKANDLEVIGLGEFAVRELNKALEAAPESPKINLRLAQLYSRRGENFQATLVLRKGYPDLYSYRESDVPREAWEIFFPLVAWSAIKEEAKRYGIDPYIAAGLIRQESVFNPNATSRVGARGLMQVMPATGQLVSKRQGGGTISAADLYNPSLNIKLGMNYLAQVLGQFGRIEYAAAAYNAGPSRAQRWIAERGSMDIEDWIESIPFSETRGYVQGVLRYAANYRRLYKE